MNSNIEPNYKNPYFRHNKDYLCTQIIMIFINHAGFVHDNAW